MYPMHPDDADFTPSSAAEIDRAFAVSGCDPEADKCRCRGHGWVGSERDSHYTCPYHFKGQAHPESYHEEYDDGGEEAERIQARQVGYDADRYYDSGTAEDLPF